METLTEGPDRTADAKVRWPWRLLAILCALILGLFVGGFTAGAIEGIDSPRCEEVESGAAERPEDGECSDTGETQKSIANVTGIAGSAFAALAVFALFAFGFTGRRHWLRRSGKLLAVALVTLALTFLVTRL